MSHAVMPRRNIEWSKIPRGTRVTLEGLPGNRWYLVHLPDGAAVAIWSGQVARLAQGTLNGLVSATARRDAKAIAK
jgi:hypothetical protein